MMDLFAGLDRAYGKYTLNGEVNERGKAGGNAYTASGLADEQVWQDHLDGRDGVGIVPIRDDGTCVWGCIDVDIYNLDVEALSHRVVKNNLPLIVCRSKSGGAHLMLFMKEATSCKVVRRALLICAQILGYEGCEIFPKQENLATKQDTGNWLNMPYFDADRTTRYAVIEGAPITSIEDFLQIAENAKVSEQEIAKIKVPEHELLEEAPPCLQVLARNGIPEGGRNDSIFSFGVYAKLRYGEEQEKWEPQLDTLNEKLCHPPLPRKEMNTIIKQLGKKDYFYRCEVPPLCNHCNKDLCRHRKYGIGNGGGSDDPGVLIDGMTKIDTEPPMWIMSVNGIRMQMETAEFMSQPRFKKRVIESLTVMPTTIGTKAWDRLIGRLLKEADIIYAPKDASPRGQLCYYIEQFCTTKAQARARDELLMGKPWTEDGVTYFRSTDFFKYLEQQKFRAYTGPQIFATLKDEFAITEKQFKIKGKCVRCWSVAEFVQQDSKHAPAAIPEVPF